jgi:AcrR family transcriptional regulator
VTQRARILNAMVHVVRERGYAGTSITRVCERAKVSHRSFYDHFDGLPACFLAILEQGSAQVSDVITAAFASERSWLDGARAGLAALLAYFDSHESLAHVLLVEATAAGPWARRARERHVADITSMIEARWRSPDQPPLHPLVTAGAMASLLGILQSHLVAASDEPLIALLGPMMGLVTAPYLSPAAVAREVKRSDELAQSLIAGTRPPTGVDPASSAVPDALRDPRAYRARACLCYVADHPGTSNRQIAAAIGIAGHTQISALLARLHRMRLVSKRTPGAGYPNAWSLTALGALVADAITASERDALSG